MSTAVRLAWAVVPDGASRREVAWDLIRDLVPGTRLSNACARCGGPHGPVRVEGGEASASVGYAGAHAIVAVADASVFPVIGVDAEPEADARRDAAGMAGVLGAGRPATVRDWTRVEAALKADGRGVRVDPAHVVVTERDGAWSAVVPGGGTFLGWDAAGPAGVLVSVAVRPPQD